MTYLWTHTPALVYYSDPVILTDFEIIPIEVAQGVGVITTKVFFFNPIKLFSSPKITPKDVFGVNFGVKSYAQICA
jgi:hypothetical protein